jgi:hypothetical protein
MNSVAAPTRTLPSRSTIAMALAAIVTVAVIFESGAMNRSQPAASPAPAALSVQAIIDVAPPAAGPMWVVDWSRATTTPITPAESVGAYER